MIKTKNILLLTLLISILCSFTSFAKEGMSPLKYTKNEQIWYYIQDDDTRAKNQWREIWDNWYYFGEDGESKQNTWADIDGKWYYFDQWSIMQHDTTTPDGNTVGSDGVWIPTDGETAPVQETAAGK